MSKVINALKRVEEERAAQHIDGDEKALGAFKSFKQELAKEIQQVEEAVADAFNLAKTEEQAAPAAPATSPVPAPAPAAAPTPTIIQTPAPAPTLTKEQATTFDQLTVRITQELQACERQVARHAASEASLKSQLAALGRIVAQVEQERTAAQKELERSSQETAALERGRQALLKQLQALKGCDDLSADVQIAEQVMSHYQDQAEQSRRQVDQLKLKLAQALASTGTRRTATEGS